MTMYRYMTFMWDAADDGAARAAAFLGETLHQVSPHRWEQAWSGDGLAIHHSGEQKGRMQTYRLKGGCGAVLGRLFRNDYTSVVDDPGEYESRRILETGGQRLIDDYWGRYVAFLDDAPSRTRYVLRDPSGAFPCFYTRWRGVTIYFSDMQDAAGFAFLPFTVNWDFIKAELKLPLFQKTITGLNEVLEVLPAECLTSRQSGHTSDFLWNPTAISLDRPIDDPDVAAAQLRHTVTGAIGALAGCYDKVLHSLGGLDSSIALACMAQAPNRPEIICVNNFTKSPGGEERHYVRQVAKMHNVELLERELDGSKVNLSRIRHSNRLAKPLGYLDCIGAAGELVALAKERKIDAFTFGVGGDQVFYQLPRNFSALDFVRRHGIFGRGVLRVAIEASRYGRKSLFTTAKDMMGELLRPDPCYEYVHKKIFENLTVPFVDWSIVGESHCENFLHPLLVPGDLDLKGKYKHIRSSAFFSLEYYDHWDTEYYSERLSVFLTQPIVECGLRTPTWIMAYGGVDRGLARKAFCNDLPPDLVRRFSKSAPTEFYDAIYAANIELLKECLLEGVLVLTGILDRRQLEAALSNASPLVRNVKHFLIFLFGMEIWVRGWLKRSSTSCNASQSSAP